MTVANADSLGSESRTRTTALPFDPDSAYTDTSIPPPEEEYDRQVRFLAPPHPAYGWQGQEIESRSVDRPRSQALVHEADQTQQLIFRVPKQEAEREEEGNQDHGLHHPAQVPRIVPMPGHGLLEQSVPYQMQQAPVQEEDEEEEHLPPVSVKGKKEYIQSNVEKERQALKKKRPELKAKHPLLKHFPKFFSYLDKDEALDQDPEEPEVPKKTVLLLPQVPPPPPPHLAHAGVQEETGAGHEEEEEEQTAVLIHPGSYDIRRPVRPQFPPQLPPLAPIPHPPPHPPMRHHPEQHIHDEEPLFDGIPDHHYTPQLSGPRPLLVPSLRLGLRLAMPLRPGKVPTTYLNAVPEPDYKSFDPLPRKMGSKVADRFYSSNIVQDIGLVYPPKSVLDVKFPNGAVLCLGNHLSVIDSFHEPRFSWPPVRASIQPPRAVAHRRLKHVAYQPLYTIIVLDPDLPLMDGQYLHMLRVNIPSPGKKGTAIVNYINPLPIIPALGTIASPNHRYVFLVFAQTRPLDPHLVKQFVAERSHSFRIRHFVKKFALETQPVAGNFFYGRLYVKTKVIC